MSGDAGLWRKTLVYLGLVEEPEEHDEFPERYDGYGQAPAAAHGGQPERTPEGRAVPAAAAAGTSTNVRPLRVPEPGAAHVRPVEGARGRVDVVAIGDFEDVQQVGERFRAGIAVVIDLRQAEGSVGRRVLDFVSGMTYALRGRLQPAGQRAFLLTPDGLELSADERARLAELGFGVGA